MRAGELADLEADAVVQIGAGHWLCIPLGKLRNDRYVPLHPELVQLLATWTAASLEHIRRHRRLVADHRGPLDRYVIGRIVARVVRAAGVPRGAPAPAAAHAGHPVSTVACGWKPSPPCWAIMRVILSS
jgi:integrase